MDLIIWAILLVTIILVVSYLQNRKSSARPDKEKNIYHYARKDVLMSQSESDFLKVVIEALGNDYHVFAQVHLTAIVDHKVRNGQNWKAAFRHINGKSVDYVITDKENFKPLAAIELDDWSHETETRQQRDTEVERILEEAQLPLIRIQNWRSLSKDEIHQKIIEKLPVLD